MATRAQRVHASAVMDWLVSNEPLIGYLQARPMTTKGLREQMLADIFRAGKRVKIDCSEAATLICRLAGLSDPCGRNYDGSGNTLSMLGHLKHYADPVAADVGALVVFGPLDDARKQHVCMVRERGRDPKLFSHGQEIGPLYLPLSEERKAHLGPVTFLSISKL